MSHKEDFAIVKLDAAQYAGRKFTMRYVTGGYYDIRRTETGFQMAYVRLEKPAEKSFEDEMFGEWLEKPVAYGAFADGRLIGYAEGALEAWNNRYRISNIGVFEAEHRRRGIGTALMAVMLQEARGSGARMAVLETQTCNEKAIAFYRKHGFEVIGFDLFAYSNDDAGKHEVRLEMGKVL